MINVYLADTTNLYSWETTLRNDVVCADGFFMSVQASRTHYCRPRSDFGPWSSVEVGYPSVPESLLDDYMQQDGIAGWVPVAVVRAIIEKHGGLMGE